METPKKPNPAVDAPITLTWWFLRSGRRTREQPALRACTTVKTMAALAAMVGTCTAGLAWAEILYRLKLFVADCGCQRREGEESHLKAGWG
jgi:hypothetical protein